MSDTPRTDALEKDSQWCNVEIREDLAWKHARELERELGEHRFADLEHEHLGCPTAKTGIYAERTPSFHGERPQMNNGSAVRSSEKEYRVRRWSLVQIQPGIPTSVLAVDFAHKHTADFPLIEEGKNEEEVRLRRVMFLKGWGAALAGFKAGYLARARGKK